MDPALFYLSMSTSFTNKNPAISKNDLDSCKVIVPINSPLILSIQSLPSFRPPSNCNSHARLSISGNVCRICHEDDIQEELISPCTCAGTLGLAHATCIEKWLSSSNTTCCEICKYPYNLFRKPKSVFQWLKTKSLPNGPSGICGDIFCLVLLTPLCIGSVYLCSVGAGAYLKHSLWEGTGLIMLCCFLTAVYILWCFVAMRQVIDDN